MIISIIEKLKYNKKYKYKVFNNKDLFVYIRTDFFEVHI